MADALALGASESNLMRVQVPLPAPMVKAPKNKFQITNKFKK